jgi:hypothetical protein
MICPLLVGIGRKEKKKERKKRKKKEKKRKKKREAARVFSPRAGGQTRLAGCVGQDFCCC